MIEMVTRYNWLFQFTVNYCWLVRFSIVIEMVVTENFWWLVRVTLVVDWRFLPQNFGQVVGTYEGLLWLSECTWVDDSTLR